MKWFRFYNEAAGDFKVQLLEPPQFKDWVNLLCMASENSSRGYLPPIKQIAYVFRTSPEDAQNRVNALIAEGLVDVTTDGRLRPHNWDARQPEGDDAAARMRAKRAEEKARKSAEKKAASQPKKKPVPEPEANDRSGEFGMCSEHVPNLSEPVTNMFSVDKIRLEERREEMTTTSLGEVPPSSSPSSSNGVVEMFTLNPDHAALIETAKAAFGSEFADTVAEMGRDIQDTLSGRWDCYAAAIKFAQRSVKPIDNLHLYCLRTGEKFTRNGIPPEPVASKPSNGRPAEKPEPAAPRLARPDVEVSRRYAGIKPPGPPTEEK